MTNDQWVRARFDEYAQFSGRIAALARFDHYSARELRARIQAEYDRLQTDLGRIDGLVMDNGQQPADHTP